MMIEMIDYIENLESVSKEDLMFQKKVQNIYKKNLKLPNVQYKIFDVEMSKNFIKKHNFLINET